MDIEANNPICKKCTRIHCNGKMHEDTLEPFVYPICHICGIELCDLIELLENNSFRNTERCELCCLKYDQQHDAHTHFEAHFYRSNNRCEIRFYCLICSDNTQENPIAPEPTIIDSSRETVRLKSGTTRREQLVSRKEHKVTTVTEHRVSETKIKTNFDHQHHNEILNEDNEMQDVYSPPYQDQGDATQMVDDDILEEIDDFVETISELDETNEDGDLLDNPSLDFNDNKRVKCPLCRKRFGTKLEMLFHQSHYHVNMLQEDEQNEIKCPLCDKVLDSTAMRLNHVNAVHRNRDTKMIHCPQCPKLFKHMSTIIDHMVGHQETVRHVCDICGKGFRRLGNLQGHYATHNEETSYACHLCTKTFKTHQLRRKHISYVHTIVKRLKCEQCDKRFNDHSDLRRHRWVHGGYEKKVECNLCDMRFYEHKRLRAHQKTHFAPKKKKERPAKSVISD